MAIATPLQQRFINLSSVGAGAHGLRPTTPCRDRNEQTLDAHIAAKLVWSVVRMLVGTFPSVIRRLGRWESLRTAHLSKEETRSKVEAKNRNEFVDGDVRDSLAKCERRRSKQRCCRRGSRGRIAQSGMVASSI